MMSAFAKLVSRLKRKEHLSDNSARAIAATIGRKKYGKKKFTAMEHRGRKRGRRNR